MDTGQIIILIVYALGTLITVTHLRGKIKALKTQVDTQSGILSSVEKFMSIFDLDKVETYVKMNEKKFLMEKEEAVKAVEKQFKSKADRSIQLLLNEMLELYGVLIQLSYAFAANPYFEKSINEMKDIITKQNLLEAIQREKARIKALGIDSQLWITQASAFISRVHDKHKVKDKAEVEKEEGNNH